MNQCWRTCVGALIALSIPFGCTGTETGNPPRAVVSFQMTSSHPEQFSFTSDGMGALVSYARLGVERVSLQECGGPERLETETDLVVELEGPPQEVEFPVRSICFVELVLSARDVKWGDAHPGTNPELSWGFAGFAPGEVPFFIEDSQSISVVFRPELSDLPPNGELSLVVDVAELVDYMELVQLPPDADGALTITEQENSSSLDAIRSRWAASWALYLSDGEGVPTLVAPGEEQ